MKVRDLTVTAAQLNFLRSECNVGEDVEGACQLLCGASDLHVDPWANGHLSTERELRMMVHRVEPLPRNRVRGDKVSVSWDMDCYVGLLRKAREEGLHPGICHSHPSADTPFSRQDDENEGHLRDLLQRRNRNRNQVLTSLLFRGENRVDARIWGSAGPPRPARVRVLGSELVESSQPRSAREARAGTSFLQRQELAVGVEAVERLQGFRIGVVGCGGTGSATATLLARLGVGRLLLIDPDTIAETNLNRLHGSTRQDVDDRRLKVQVIKEHVENMGLGTRVSVRAAPLADAAIARLLRTCDIVFGCTDDHLGRLILNRLAYFYLLPVIDMGLSVAPGSQGRPAQVSGRVTVLRPGNTCLLCRGVVNPRRAREQGLRYKNPEEYGRQAKEGYIIERDTQTPVVGTFTTETATAAINEFLAAVAGLRGQKGWASERTIRYDLDRCRPTGCTPVDGCPLCDCADYWGVGDHQPFLDLGGL